MLHGVFFQRTDDGIVPHFVNRFVRTDAFLAGQQRGATILPSISSLISPLTSKSKLMATLVRATTIAWLAKVSRLTVANTTIVFHDRRLLATCESGPPVHVRVPALDTVAYHVFPDGVTGEGGLGRGERVIGKGQIGVANVAGKMLEEWTSGHPKRDPVTGDLVFIGYNIFATPFVTCASARTSPS